MENNLEQTIKEILDRLGVSYEDVSLEESSVLDSPRYVIKSEEDTAILIGNRGETLHSIRYLLKKILEKKERNTNFIIDVGDYQEKKIQDIKNRAVILCERARFFKKDIEVPPMSAYERMVVHTALQDQKDVKTESFGFGKNRRVVIKFLGEENQEEIF